jgi:hypothetical protein
MITEAVPSVCTAFYSHTKYVLMKPRGILMHGKLSICATDVYTCTRKSDTAYKCIILK